ncbi:hypothetical protein Nepgr_010287 [Nepenthes gracilis]|uniref:Bifunctional inhibitor/plant lipid transfer protein/seed storage helical domain-containing protein n=1 Tax=Nepenthes gracilis TaxID=150966 RepID=A0AAD3SD47_NEPGR|nr:hypothetical protein Nepgr_010287 [Nepenthes gracilis]
MARPRVEIGMVVVLAAAMLWAGATAQISSGCYNVLLGLSPCLDYVTGSSSTPSSECCTKLASVVKSQPLCLCELLNGAAASLGISINQTRALALPGACKVQVPSISLCSKVESPAPSPAPSPTGSGKSTGSGTTTAPAPKNGSSAGSSIKLSFTMLVSLLLIASYASGIISV